MNLKLNDYYQFFSQSTLPAKKKQRDILIKFRAKERLFNKIQINETCTTKTVYDAHKGNCELFFYKNVPLNLQRFFPKILSSRRRTRSISYDMELIPALDVSVLYVKNILNLSGFRTVLKNVDQFFLNAPQLKVSNRVWKNNAKKIIVTKLNHRWAAYKRTSHYLKINQAFEKKHHMSLDEFQQKLQKKLLAYIDDMKDQRLLLGHGDLCFSNILLLHNKKIKLVDPRGARTRADLFITQYYDLAKLSQCVHGQYDCILNSQEFRKSSFPKIFDRWVLNKKMDIDFVRLIESSLFLSLLPMHMDRADLHSQFIESALSAYKAAP